MTARVYYVFLTHFGYFKESVRPRRTSRVPYAWAGLFPQVETLGRWS